jgi:co-chaperonin GroES (HSP10)
MRVINDWILVEPIGQEEKRTASGIILPKKAEDESVKMAKVLQISEDVAIYMQQKLEKPGASLSYKVGDTVYYYGKTGIPIIEEGKTLMFLKWDGMLAVK